MLILDENTKLQVILSGAVATNESDLTAHYVDSPAYSPALSTATTNGGTAVDLLAAPAAGVLRHVKALTICNADTAPITVTFRTRNGSTNRTVFKAVLAVGDSAFYEDASGWRVTDAMGALRTVVAPMSSSGPYTSRPDSGSVPHDYIYVATDVGVAPGCRFRNTASGWQQDGEHYLCVNVANVTADYGHLVKSAFDVAPTLPNGCLAVGTRFKWAFRELITDSGSNDGACVYQMLIGSTDVGNLTYAAFGEYNRGASFFEGEMVVRSLGASGSVMGTMANSAFNTVLALVAEEIVLPSAATTVDTTGAISPDVQITLSSITNSPVRNIVEASIRVSGLA